MSNRHLLELEAALKQQLEKAGPVEGLGDDEAAHEAQGRALVAALRAIAEGVDDPQQVARRALTATEVKHMRWYA